MPKLIKTTVGSERLDRFLVQAWPDIPRSRWGAWIEAGKVSVNGVPAFKNGQALKAGDAVETDEPDFSPPAAHLAPEEIYLPTLYEDDRLWIVNKPAGMVVHPGPGHPSGTVLNALLARIGATVAPSAISSAEDDEAPLPWPGLVHRLDRHTSGCMAMAKDEAAKTCLQAQFKARTVEKTYLAIVRLSRKLPEIGCLLVDAPIGRHRVDRTKMSIQAKGKEAQTSVKTLCASKGLALVSCDILTGRTHQIRVHLASLGAPLLGDPLYGGAPSWQGLDGSAVKYQYPALHAWKLALVHPDGPRVSVAADPPEAFLACLRAFGLEIPT
jgi:23S rRNA pseudouridine1911/1915/1917 synthase